MNVTTGTFATPNGARYLQQLCKHFAHKIETRCEPPEGELRFDMGVAYLRADDTGLTVRFELENDDSFEAAQHVIDSHLARFAFREDFSRMDWDWTPPRTVRAVARDLLGGVSRATRARAPGLHAFLRKLARRNR